MKADRAMAAELEQTVSGIAEIQMFNAQSLRSKRFHEVSEDAAQSDASSVVWMQATANGSQVFVALSTVVVLLVGIGFSREKGTFASARGLERRHRPRQVRVARRHVAQRELPPVGDPVDV
jgi:ATP-binding cassette, subfamily B, bacterial